MIRFLKGKLASVSLNSIIVEVQGIGYKVFIPSSVYYSLPKLNEEIMIFTYLHVREDILQLFGFLTEKDLELFEQIINVSGIGPKNGLGILSGIAPDKLKQALVQEDLNVLTKIPGIGKKTAQRMILDLKDKINLDETEGEIFTEAREHSSESFENALDALVALGYHRHAAKRAIVVAKETGSSDHVESLIKGALKVLAKS